MLAFGVVGRVEGREGRCEVNVEEIRECGVVVAYNGDVIRVPEAVVEVVGDGLGCHEGERAPHHYESVRVSASMRLACWCRGRSGGPQHVCCLFYRKFLAGFRGFEGVFFFVLVFI